MDVRLFGSYRCVPLPTGCRLHVPYGNVGRFLVHRPFSLVSRSFRTRLRAAAERDLLRSVPDGGAVYVWPLLSTSSLMELKRRGCFIAVEVINFHTEAEKRIIEAEMARENLQYIHYVTSERIARQQVFLEQADLVFSSNEQARQSLIDFGCASDKIVLTRYGPQCAIEPTVTRPKRAAPVFLFVGRINLEKGVHHLLRGWQAAGEPGELHLYGRVDPHFAERFAELLAMPSVRLCGFTRQIASAYQSADVFLFLSLSEGGPQVTIEAAGFGLPMITSPNGGGRIAVDEETALIVDPADTGAVAAAIRRVAGDMALCQRLGRAAQVRAREFTWERAAAERFGALLERMTAK